MRRLPAFPALRAFECAARQLSFTRAAEELCVTPSAVSHQVKLLEGWVGTPLFERTARRITLTQRGRELYLSASKCLDDLAIAFRVAEHPNKRGAPARLRVCADAGFVELWFASRLEGFFAKVPNPPIEVFWASTAQDYKQYRADIVLHYGRADRLPYESISQWRYHEFAVCSPSLITKARPIASVSDLRRQRLLHERGTESWMHWLRWAGLQSVDWAVDGPIYHGASTCLGAAAAGQGVALADELVGGDLLMSGQIVKPLGQTRDSDYTLTLLCRREVLNDAGTAAFVNWVRPAIDEYLSTTRPLIQPLPYRARPAAYSALTMRRAPR
jgi:LysR family transcriptional regulator, glycine cleavage system transcriptional activator